MRSLNNVLFVVLCCTIFVTRPISAQNVSEATLVVSGSGADEVEATKVALRSAIEQTFGVFVSANTTVLNADIVRDEVATISSGNIKSYEKISAIPMPNGQVEVSLKATVSISSLISYAKSKGSEVELSGQTFLMNVKLKRLNKDNEYAALQNLVEQVKVLSENIFDYEMAVKEPVVKGGGYEVKLDVISKKNENFYQLMNLIERTLSSIELSPDEIKNYDEIGLGYCKEFAFNKKQYLLRNDLRAVSNIFNKITLCIKCAATSWVVSTQGFDAKYWVDMGFKCEELYKTDRPSFNYDYLPKFPIEILSSTQNKASIKDNHPFDVSGYIGNSSCFNYKFDNEYTYTLSLFFTDEELFNITGFIVSKNTEISKQLSYWASDTRLRIKSFSYLISESYAFYDFQCQAYLDYNTKYLLDFHRKKLLLKKETTSTWVEGTIVNHKYSEKPDSKELQLFLLDSKGHDMVITFEVMYTTNENGEIVTNTKMDISSEDLSMKFTGKKTYKEDIMKKLYL